ncbi:MAG: 50S ribosomal protein L3 [Patescibacteria group bacterium]
MTGLLGRKLKMSQIWKGNTVIPVTVIEVAPNKVEIVRTPERDGYKAVQLRLGKNRKEFRHRGQAGWQDMEPGAEATVSFFKEGDKVKISGLTKGRGFQGVVKRHGFHGGPKTHGQKNRFRAPGSIGSTAFQRVVPGRRMAGRMGQERVTIKNLEVAGVDADKNLLLVRGAVPGARGALLEIVRLKSAS